MAGKNTVLRNVDKSNEADVAIDNVYGNKDGIITQNEQTAYDKAVAAEKKQNEKQNRSVVKSFSKAHKNLDENALEELEKNDIYKSDTPPAGLTKKQQETWYKQKAMIKNGGSVTVVNQSSDNKSNSPLQAGVGGAVSGNNNNDGADKETVSYPTSNNSTPSTGSDAINTAAKANDAMKQNTKDDLEDKNKQYKEQNGVDGVNGQIEMDSTPKQLQEAIAAHKDYKTAVKNNEAIKGYKGQQAMLDSAMGNNKYVEKNLPKVKESVLDKLNKKKNLLMTQLGNGSYSLEGGNPEEGQKIVQQYDEAIVSLKNGAMDEMAPLIEQYGDAEDKADFETISKCWDKVQEMVDENVPMDDVAKQLKSAKKELEDKINEEKKTDENILTAKGNYKKELQDFLFYMFDDLTTFVFSYVALANGDVGTAFNIVSNNAMVKRDKSYSDAETKYNTDILNAFSKTNQNAITGQSDAQKEMESFMAELEKQRALNGLSEEQQIQAVDAAYNAFMEYQKKMDEENGGQFSIYKLREIKTGNSAVDAILQGLSYTATNAKSAMSLLNGLDAKIRGSLSGNTTSDERLKDVSMVNTKGKASSWMDNAFNSVKTPQTDPMVSIDKQNTLAMAKQGAPQGGAPQQGAPQTQTDSGFGRTNLA